MLFLSKCPKNLENREHFMCPRDFPFLIFFNIYILYTVLRVCFDVFETFS